MFNQNYETKYVGFQGKETPGASLIYPWGQPQEEGCFYRLITFPSNVQRYSWVMLSKAWGMGGGAYRRLPSLQMIFLRRERKKAESWLIYYSLSWISWFLLPSPSFLALWISQKGRTEFIWGLGLAALGTGTHQAHCFSFLAPIPDCSWLVLPCHPVLGWGHRDE